MRADGKAHSRVTEPTEIDYGQVTLFRVPEDQPPTEQEIFDLDQRMNSSPTWSPTGEIIFASIRDTLALSAAAVQDQRRPFVNANELYAIEPDGSGLRRITEYNIAPGSFNETGPPRPFEPAECESPDFCFAGLVITAPLTVSPDGAQIAVTVSEIRFSECCGFTALLDKATGELAELRIGTGEPEGGYAYGFAWAPDGAEGVTYLWRGNPLGDPYVEELAVRELSSGLETLLVRAGDDDPLTGLGPPAWSPTDDRIAFCARSASTFAAPYTIYITAVEGGESEPLLALQPTGIPNAKGRCEPDWSPDGRFIVVSDGAGGILVIDAVTGASAVVARGTQPAWGPED